MWDCVAASAQFILFCSRVFLRFLFFFVPHDLHFFISHQLSLNDASCFEAACSSVCIQGPVAADVTEVTEVKKTSDCFFSEAGYSFCPLHLTEDMKLIHNSDIMVI